MLAIRLLALLATGPALAGAKGFLSDRKHTTNATSFKQDVEGAMATLQGCGGHVKQEQLDAIEASLLPMWRALPKDANGRIERALLRHLVNRYFRRAYSFVVRGFEETRPLAGSAWDSENVLSERVPGYIEAALASRHAEEAGFGLRDAVSMVAVIEEIIFDSETELLEYAYEYDNLDEDARLGEQALLAVLKRYLAIWIVGTENPRYARDPDQMVRRLPMWPSIVDLAQGQIKHFEFQRRSSTATRLGDRFSGQFSMDDAHKIVRSITESFASYIGDICRKDLRAPLESLDSQHTGRIPLSRFYSAPADGVEFAESRETLRETGALDESNFNAPQVLIANYIYGMSNCIVASSHYQVCCENLCEGIHGEIEGAFGGPLAAPGEVLAFVENMTRQAAWDAEDATLPRTLGGQLAEIAEHHGGQVPLHGRLFAQWLHYVFPRECPFPHKAGTVTSSARPERATDKEIQEAVRAAAGEAPGEEGVETHWMSQWSSEEELMADLAPPSKRRSGGRTYLVLGGAALLLLAAVGTSGGKDPRGSGAGVPLTSAKAHLV